MTIEAKCCCGAVAITLSGDPTMNAICHCDNCRRRTGAAFGWSVYFPEAAVVSEAGETAVYAFDSSGGRQERHFCPTCGSTLWWRSPGAVGIAGGCLPAGAVGEPTISAQDSRRLAWVVAPEAAQRWS
jgi:hypothetical protein